MEPLFETKVSLNYEQYKKLCYSNVRKNKIVLILNIDVIFLIPICLYLLFRNILLSIGGIVLYVVIVYLALEFTIKKNWNSYKNIPKDGIYMFYEDAMETRNSNGYSLVKYSDLYKITETKENFYLYIGNNQAHIIIKDNCSEGLIAFLSEIKNQVNEKK